MIDYETYRKKMDAAKDAEEAARTIANRKDLSQEQRENLSKELKQRAEALRRQAMRYAW